MEQLGRITHIYTKGYVEVDLGGLPAVAENYVGAEKGDLVAVLPAPFKTNRLVGLSYLMPPFLAVLGFFLGTGQGRGVGEALSMALILGAITLATAWLMNRRARMRRRMSYQIVRVCEKAPDLG